MLEYASGFASEQCPEGIVAIAANTLRILALEKLGAVFNQVLLATKYHTRVFLATKYHTRVLLATKYHTSLTRKNKSTV